MFARFNLALAAALALTGCQQAAGGEQATQGLGEVRDSQRAFQDVILLHADGLEVTGATGTYLAFNSPREAVERELARALGPIVDRSRNEECGAGPIDSTSFPGGLTLNFQMGRLEGWYLARGTGTSALGEIVTVEGVTVGSSQSALKAITPLNQVEESTLGEEFTTGSGIGGLLDTIDGTKTVAALYSGTTCFFR